MTVADAGGAVAADDARGGGVDVVVVGRCRTLPGSFGEKGAQT
jgi:hypothetical protein